MVDRYQPLYQKIIGQLWDSYQQGKLGHSFLFLGADQGQKKDVAIQLVKRMLCEKSTEYMPACGQCGSCKRVSHGQHEGMFVIQPDGQQIKIEQIRGLLEYLSLQSITRARIIIIENMDKMTAQASNSLLKILEEPPQNTFFFLLAPSSQHVLSTIRSRSQRVLFPMRKDFSDEDVDLKNAQKEVADFFQYWVQDRKAYLQPEVREMIKGKENAALFAQQVVYFLRDFMMWRSGDREGIFFKDNQKVFQKLDAISDQTLSSICQKAIQIESALLANRDPQLVFEEFWIQTQRLENAL